MPIPLWFLLPVAHAVQLAFGARNPIHPVRVRKAATPTHIVPETLQQLGFRFKYDFASSLQHWMMVSPEDFAFAGGDAPPPGRRKLVRGGERRRDQESARTSSESEEKVRPRD
jgi:hypothetical protein